MLLDTDPVTQLGSYHVTIENIDAQIEELMDRRAKVVRAQLLNKLKNTVPASLTVHEAISEALSEE